MKSDDAAPPPVPPPEHPSKLRSRASLGQRARQVFPWLIAAAIVGYVFSRVPIAEAWSVARHARLDLFVPLVGVSVVAWFLIDAAVYAYVFSRWNAPLSYREARSLRGMSYLLTPIHWNVGKAAVILRLRQTKSIPLLESTSTVMLYQTADGLVLAFFATLGLTLLAGEEHSLAGVRWTTATIIVFILANLVLLRATWPRVGWLDWWRGLSIHHAHRQISIGDLLFVVAMKGAYHAGFVLVYYVGSQAFGIDMPIALALAATPIVQAVGALPITPAGLGTQQAAMLYFFGGRFGGNGTEAAVVAFGFSLPIALVVGRCLLGLFYVRDLGRRHAHSDPTDSVEGSNDLRQAEAPPAL